MRDLHCRAVSLEDGSWQYGYLVLREQDVHGTPGYFLQQFGGLWIKVDPDTVGQYTGHEGIEGKKVYEGDILNFPGTDDQHYLVKWLEESGQWGIMFGPKAYNIQMGSIGLAQFMEIAGNIQDNEELING